MTAIGAWTDKTKLAQLDLRLEQAHYGSGAFCSGWAWGRTRRMRRCRFCRRGQGRPDAAGSRLLPGSDVPRFVKLREQYVDNMVKTFGLLGDAPEKAAAEAAERDED